jgi:predicted oxidoreductase
MIRTAPTLDALAGKIWVDPAGLVETVQRYNDAVERRSDPKFGRTALPMKIETGPYYGIVSQAGILISREGVQTDADLRVVDANGRVIPGLYAVGEVPGSYQFMGDSHAGPAIALGRTFGRNVAERSRATVLR